MSSAPRCPVASRRPCSGAGAVPWAALRRGVSGRMADPAALSAAALPAAAWPFPQEQLAPTPGSRASQLLPGLPGSFMELPPPARCPERGREPAVRCLRRLLKARAAAPCCGPAALAGGGRGGG